ncbi:MAG: transcription-repair coupling factor [Planctomycetales bacterium]|nr:transcription-repair coupling factor [Planctomycetales bacterium]NIM09639.1 transcription-repair coupling factor [Planctomycetales bacterium]NIN09122.1 transcription-repair coupling factor [Planctomycetales bacterium]NIN78229.1 transcription-repair coupling factor [Planctomycetales bacterium]NIO35420.1 transcription-repair coupling factor [Planctomycetales bacterium]
MTRDDRPPTAAPPLADLADRLGRHRDFADLLTALQPGASGTLDGVWGSACALVAAAIGSAAAGPLVVVCPEAGQVDDFAAEFSLFSTKTVATFPAWESDPGERVVHDEVFGQRLRVLKWLASGQAQQGDQRPEVVVTSIQSLLQPVSDQGALQAATRSLQVGQQVDVDPLIGWLVQSGLHRTSAVQLPGEVAARGGILDIFAPDWFAPVRIELCGDHLESIRRFDVATQRSTAQLDAVQLTVLEADRPASSHLADYLPGNAWWLLLEPARQREEAGHYLQRTEKPQDHFSQAAVMQRIGRFATLTAEAVATARSDFSCSLPIQSVERFSGEMSRVRDELDGLGLQSQIHVVCLTAAEVERVGEILGDAAAAREGRMELHVGRLKTGFRILAPDVVVISGGELFLREEIHRPSHRRLGRAIDSFTELRRGDLVVHLAHGIGRYRGTEVLERENLVEEHLVVEFAEGTKIFVPASKIGLVQKYVGGRKGRPRLAKIGGKRWAQQKRAAERSVTDLAAEMLQLQASRQSRPGIRFPLDSHWQREFDASFPYHETPDQLAAMAAIKQDMCQARPMDRLLCGDVGFGKTELAVRAAFKAVDSGYQVAVLVPTTILAEQHLRTFQGRMAEFPIEIAVLSRFCTRKQQTQTIQRLATGQIDIVIGTHRLAQRDVQFENLGLVVIDEEQRFGVEIKERLKQLRQTVDVLTMTATPIPRTLHLSLVGARDISNLAVAPEDRLAIETRVTRFQPELIRHAILRELNRNGQIFFVHNRVQDIQNVAAHLRQIVPEASIDVGHGQMPESQLEQVMTDFVAGRFDVLLATTIVESGLDIPNANTIFIDDADRYGLADLHQLRGRVGRYKHRAYCYLLVDQHKHLSPTAARRLRAIEEFSDMGAGFAISMRDLEIRGAGNILGTQQSGHIAAVGYEYYCQLLENVIRQQRRQPAIQQLLDVDIDLPGEAHFPDDYIADMRLKLDLYRRLARVTTDGDLEQLRAELADRFGPPPAVAERMLALAGLRIDAAVWAVHAITKERQFAVLTYTDRARIRQLAQSSGGVLRIVDDQAAYLPLASGRDDPDQIIQQVKSLLQG